MSSTQRPTVTYECDNPECEDSFPKGMGYKGHCDESCYYQRRGRKAENLIKHNHCLCSSCYRRLKTVEKPPDGYTVGMGRFTAEAIIGFQYSTEHAVSGNYGLECECGNTSHSHSEEVIQNNIPIPWRLDSLFMDLRKEGQIDAEFDLITFADMWWETNSFQEALGRALYE